MALKTLYFVDDIMQRYRCRSKDTARRYMRQMGAMGSPLFVTEDMISSWEESKRKPEVRKKIRRVSGEMIIPRRKVG